MIKTKLLSRGHQIIMNTRNLIHKYTRCRQNQNKTQTQNHRVERIIEPGRI